MKPKTKQKHLQHRVEQSPAHAQIIRRLSGIPAEEVPADKTRAANLYDDLRINHERGIRKGRAAST
ncbi:hypothetical protein V9W64_07365 [Neisseria leonii]|uniref:Uncharacterized protein n=1 Tax=Neisseria leonii TaxID=2995413 RepID=A0A9X4E625_9NEIS|nr:hypothetical protein [Neisseria sp. 51.81]MDD9328052.1 hypothetical protein [Neisseria sp. 51.81]